MPVVAASVRSTDDPRSDSSSKTDVGRTRESLSPTAPVDAQITATKTDSFPDPNSDGRAELGDTITYDINVSNTGGVDATGVTFADTIDPNTTLVPGSLRVSPLAFAESYNATKDTALNIGAPGVLANDTGTPAPTAVPIAGGATSGGGSVTLNADGSFIYTPLTGFTGTDTFTYTATNGLSPNDTATVTINVDDGPAVATTTPANGATDVAQNSNITINFTEPVNAPAGSFTLECPTGTPQAFTLSASPASSFTLDPVADLPAGTTCTVTVVASQITDTDANDPPDQLGANYVFSFGVKPLAVDDMESATGNVRIDSSRSGYSVLTNDQGSGVSITAFDATSAQGGTVNLNTGTGTFVYNPPRGFTGSDSFNYTISNAAGSDQGTVVITVTDVIWFINNAPSACTSDCDGRLTNPYTSLTAFEAVNGSAGTGNPEAGDNIFIYTGTVSYVAPLTLENNQRVIGQGATSSIETLAGISLAPDSDTLPTTGGTNPVITNGGGNGINLAQNNNIHGLTISNTAGTGISGTNFGTLTVSENVILSNTATTGTPINLSAGILAATFQSISSTGAAHGIRLANTTGTFSVSGNGGACTIATPTCSGGSIQSSSTEGVLLNNAAGVSLTRMKIQNSTSDGINASGVNGFTFDNGIITDTAGASGQNGIEFTNVIGTITVSNSAISGSPHNGIFLTNTSTNLAAFNLTNSTIQNNLTGSGNSGLLFVAAGTTVVTQATVSGSSFISIPATALAAQTQGTANIQNLTVTGSTFTTNNIGVDGNISQSSRLTMIVGGPNPGDGNAFNFSNGTAVINLNSATTTTTLAALTAKIQGNAIGTQGVVDSGARQGFGIRASIQGDTTGIITIDQNSIREVPNSKAIEAFGRSPNNASPGNGAARFRITNNTMPRPTGTNFGPCAGSTTPCPMNTVSIQALNTFNVCSIVSGNSAYDPESWPQGAGMSAYFLLRGTGSVLNLEGNTSQPADVNIASNNTVTNSTVGAADIVTTAVTVVAPGTCGAFLVENTQSQQEVDLAQAIENDASDNTTSLAQTSKTVAANRASGQSESLLAHSSRKARTTRAASTKATTTALRPVAAPSGETVNATIGTLPAGKSVRIQFQVTVDNPFGGTNQVSNQGTVSGSNFANVLTDDPAVAGNANPTVTPILTPPTISIKDGSAAEPLSGSAPAAFTVVLSHAYSQPVTVNFATANDTGGANPATAGTDYTVTSDTLTFNPGDTIQTISVPALADADATETAETFLVNLTGATGGSITDGQAVGTIKPNDTPGTIVISELRTSGPAGADDDFVELLNNTDADITVAASDSSGGWAIVKTGGTCSETPSIVAVITNGTVIPARGNYLLVGSAYSLGAYAAGNQTMSADIENDRNVALFNTADLSNIQTSTRLDAVGFGANTGNNCDLLREGATLQPAGGSTSEYSFVRKVDKGETLDSNDNAADFQVVSTTPASPVGSNLAPTLGAPGPENKTGARGPVPCNVPGTAKFDRALLDGSQAVGASPNLVHDATAGPNSTYGTMDFRRTFTNNTGGSVTRLRFRIVDMTTSPAAASSADLRARDSSVITVGPSTVQGTTLETPPAQALGGGVNSTLAAGTIAVTPLANGASINLRFLFGIEQHGNYHIGIVIETVTNGSLGQDIWELRGHTQNGGDTDGDCNTPPVADAGADQTAECVGGSASVMLDGSQSSDPDGDTPLTYEWREGATVLGMTAQLNTSLPFGSHTITLKVTDPSGAFGEDTVTVDVVDNADPVVTPPPNVTVSTGPGATSCDTYVSDATLGTATASDSCAGALTPTRSGVPAGNIFPVGQTLITYTADDGHGHTKQATQTVTVIDNTPPTVNVPSDQTVNAPANSCSANVNPGTATANDNCSGVTVAGVRSDNQLLNDPYPVGVTTITWTATDAANNMTSGVQAITVKDVTAPVITLTSGTITLSPPNHSYQTFTIANLVASASDLCDAGVDINDVVISQVTSDEVENGNGDGNTNNDIVITPDCKSVQLRRERSGNGNGRVYKITVKVKDSSGNVATAVRQIFVSKGGPVIDSGVNYTVNGCAP